VPLQTLVRLVKEDDGGVFDPEDIVVMATAFDRLLGDLKLVDRNDPVVRMLAKLVIELVRNGERDPDKIRQQVLGRYKPQEPPLSTGRARGGQSSDLSMMMATTAKVATPRLVRAICPARPPRGPSTPRLNHTVGPGTALERHPQR
jgi:hypothetical protein